MTETKFNASIVFLDYLQLRALQWSDELGYDHLVNSENARLDELCMMYGRIEKRLEKEFV